MIKGFPPIARSDARVLILGSMPSVTSLKKGEYYGNRSNDFWPIISAVFHVEFDTYQQKIDTAIDHHLAIWDVYSTCNRTQSKDSSIIDETLNDFLTFFKEHPHINEIIANGKKAYQAIIDIQKELPPIEIHLAVSTSRAYPLPFEKKLVQWKSLLT
jgi:TDG/mug DNA glycosylase family protein